MAKSKLQRRCLSQAEIELRRPTEGPTRIEGYAIVFEQVAHGEIVGRNALKKTLKERKDIKAYWSHDMAQPLGRTTNKTLELRTDEKGLWVSIEPNPETTWGQNALASVARGDVNQFSFGFIEIDGGYEEREGEKVYVLREIALYEVSPVAEPWYEMTSAEARDAYREAESAADEPPAGADHPDEGPDAETTERARVAEAVRQRKLRLAAARMLLPGGVQ